MWLLHKIYMAIEYLISEHSFRNSNAGLFDQLFNVANTHVMLSTLKIPQLWTCPQTSCSNFKRYISISIFSHVRPTSCILSFSLSFPLSLSISLIIPSTLFSFVSPIIINWIVSDTTNSRVDLSFKNLSSSFIPCTVQQQMHPNTYFVMMDRGCLYMVNYELSKHKTKKLYKIFYRTMYTYIWFYTQ